MSGLTDSRILDLYREHQGPMYLYDKAMIISQAEALLTSFDGFEFLYSVKTNPFPPVLRTIFSKGIGADAASAREVGIAVELGVARDRILFSAPGKTNEDIEETIDKSILIADSYNELRLIDAAARSRGIVCKAGVRLNPDFTMFDDEGVTGKFGIDSESLKDHLPFLAELKNTDIVGIHVHVRSQILDDGILRRYYEKIFELAVFCRDTLGWKLEFINFGGGIGIPYSQKGDRPLDVPLLGKKCAELLERFKDLDGVRLIIESGRFLVGQAGKYVTPVVDVKESRGVRYVIVRNGLNGFLRPSVAELLYSLAGDKLEGFAAEPLFTVRDAFSPRVCGKAGGSLEKVNIVGNLCTAADVVASGIELPRIEVGDLIVLSNAGSYAYSLSPLLFSSHPLPVQVLVGGAGKEELS